MSHIPLKSQKKFSVLDFRKFKENSQKIVTITCYDYTSARIIAKTNIDMILVGDSLGNVMMGLDNTLGVTLDHMIHYGQCVARGLGSQFLCIDMPFMSYQVDVKTAVVNAGRLMKEGEPTE